MRVQSKLKQIVSCSLGLKQSTEFLTKAFIQAQIRHPSVVWHECCGTVGDYSFQKHKHYSRECILNQATRQTPKLSAEPKTNVLNTVQENKLSSNGELRSMKV